MKAGEDFTATLAGARLEASGRNVLILREAGELRRRAAQALALTPGTPAVWDGRFELQASGPGWSVGAAQGRMARLGPADRARLSELPPAARAGWPVLMREEGAPVLSAKGVTVRGLTAERMRLASGETTHEDDLTRARWRNAVERPIFTGKTSRPAAGFGASDDRGPL